MTYQETFRGSSVLVEGWRLYELPGAPLVKGHDGVYATVSHFPGIQGRSYEDTRQSLYRLEVDERLNSTGKI